MTNVHSEDHDDLVLAAQILSRYHLVMVAALQETLLTNTLVHKGELANDEALLYACCSFCTSPPPPS